jgi:multiple sugar transport system ATP-binding protein
MVFQSYALYPHMTVRDNLAFGLSLRGTPKDVVQTRVQAAAEMLGIGPLLARKPRELSGGQRQRVALGRAIVREPQVFLMDEPLSNLDAQLRVQTRAELVRLHQRLGTTTIYVTHDQVEAMTMGERIAVLRDGLLQQVDTPQALYDCPANMFVASFIGSPSMNFLSGEVRAGADGMPVAAAGSLTLPLPSTPEVAALTDRRVVVGIRPEHINDVRDAGGSTSATVRAHVGVVEPLGAEVFAYLTIDGAEVVARLDSRHAPHSGDVIEVAIAADRVHLFDPVSEVALAHGQC